MTYAVLNAISVLTVIVLQNETLMAYIHCSRLHLCVQCVILVIVDNIYQTTATLFAVCTDTGQLMVISVALFFVHCTFMTIDQNSVVDTFLSFL